MTTELEIDSPIDRHEKQREATCLGIAAGLHALLFFWNPTLLKSDIQMAHDFVTVDIVEQAAPGAPAVEAPKKMSLMQTLKDMMTKSNPDEIAHVAPQSPTVPQVAAAKQPLMQDRSFTHPMTSFTPKSQMEDLANASNANQINTALRPVASLPVAGPTYTTKTFTGVKSRDLPFNVNESLSANTVPVSIALGNSSPRAALIGNGPRLSEKGNHAGITPTLRDVGGAHSDSPSLGAGASQTIALAGTGQTGNAPTGAPTGAVIQNRAGTSGGYVNHLLTGGKGNNAGAGIEGITAPTPTQVNEVVQSASSGQARKTKSGDIVGPLSNRAIVHKVIPQYPAWAEEQGIIGSVQIYFTVDASGNVRPNMQVRKTTGNSQLDQLATDALKQWKFAASEAEGEWGVITFNFSLAS